MKLCFLLVYWQLNRVSYVIVAGVFLKTKQGYTQLFQNFMIENA